MNLIGKFAHKFFITDESDYAGVEVDAFFTGCRFWKSIISSFGLLTRTYKLSFQGPRFVSGFNNRTVEEPQRKFVRNDTLDDKDGL